MARCRSFACCWRRPRYTMRSLSVSNTTRRALPRWVTWCGVSNASTLANRAPSDSGRPQEVSQEIGKRSVCPRFLQVDDAALDGGGGGLGSVLYSQFAQDVFDVI